MTTIQFCKNSFRVCGDVVDFRIEYDAPVCKSSIPFCDIIFPLRKVCPSLFKRANDDAVNLICVCICNWYFHMIFSLSLCCLSQSHPSRTDAVEVRFGFSTFSVSCNNHTGSSPPSSKYTS